MRCCLKSMLKAGIMDECDVNEDGTPQGGILSPLLANVYLDILDEYVAKQWINKKTVHQYTRQESKTHALKARSNLIPGVLVRYADDFVIITDSREHAHFWKERIGHFLEKKMKLTLSPEKTLITDVRKRYIQFLGYEYKVVRGKSRKGYIPRTIPNRKRLKSKVEEIHANILAIPKNVSRDVVIRQIHLINSQIRGLVNYYEATTWVTVAFKRYRRTKPLPCPAFTASIRQRLLQSHIKIYGWASPISASQNGKRRFITIRMKRPTAKRDGRYISTGRRKNGRTRGWTSFP